MCGSVVGTPGDLIGMKRSVPAAWLGLALLLSAPVPVGQAVAQATAEMRAGDSARVATKPGSRVNVRSGPSTGETVAGYALADSVVAINGSQRQGDHVWYDVTIADGVRGWIRGDMLERTRSPARTAQQPTPSPAAPAPPRASAEAAPSPAQQPPADDWVRFVPTLLPQVDACLGSLSLQPVVVTRVFRVEPDMVGVRLRDPSDRRWECLILKNGNYPIRLDPLGDRVRPMPGDGNPTFIRAPGEAPSDPCLLVDEIDEPATGELLGWRAFRTCPDNRDQQP